jgi:pyruvate, water dikinase
VSGWTQPLDALRAADSGTFGGKATGLGELIAGGIPVPPGFAVSTAAFDSFMQQGGLRARVDGLLSELDPDDVAAVHGVAQQVALEMRRETVPGALRSELEQRYGALAERAGETAPPVAVRSSARGEDSAEATFAGQQETYLWERGVDGVCEAIRRCWISLYSPPAITYRARLASAGDTAMGVVVQLMVDAETSGVMFTCSPITGDPSVVAINAAWGLGLGVVGGEVTPDEYVVSKVTREVLRSTIASKDIEYVPDPGGCGTARVRVPVERRSEPCLGQEQIIALVEVGRRVEGHFGSRQDVEWAISRRGTFPESLYVLQARPVTATGVAGSEAIADRGGKSALALVMGLFGVKDGELPPASGP